MFKSTLLVAAAAACFATFSVPDSRAQSITSRFEVFAEGGASTTNKLTQITGTAQRIGQPPAGDVTQSTAALRTTGRLFVGVRFYFDSHDAIEGSFSYSPSDLLLRSTCTLGCTSSTVIGQIRANFAAGNYVRTFGVKRIQPFLTFGVGGVAFRQVMAPQLGHDPFTADLGGGLDFRIWRRWTLRAEYRDWIFELPREFQAGPTGLTHNSVPSAGLAYRF